MIIRYHRTLLQEVIAGVEEFMEEEGILLPPCKKARLIVLVYEELIESLESMAKEVQH